MIFAFTQVWFESAQGKEEHLNAQGEVPLLTKTDTANKSIFLTGNADEIKQARDISLDFLKTKISNRYVGTLNVW